MSDPLPQGEEKRRAVRRLFERIIDEARRLERIAEGAGGHNVKVPSAGKSESEPADG